MIRYVLWNTQNRKGEFEFLSSTQDNWTASLKKIKQEYKSAIANCYFEAEKEHIKVLCLDVSEVIITLT